MLRVCPYLGGLSQSLVEHFPHLQSQCDSLLQKRQCFRPLEILTCHDKHQQKSLYLDLSHSQA